MAPQKTGAKAKEENSPRSILAKNLSLRGGEMPAETGSLIGAKIMAAVIGDAQRTPRAAARR